MRAEEPAVHEKRMHHIPPLDRVVIEVIEEARWPQGQRALFFPTPNWVSTAQVCSLHRRAP